MLSRQEIEIQKAKRKQLKFGLTEKDFQEEFIGDKTFGGKNLNSWETCINHGLKSRKYDKLNEPGIEQFNMKEDVDDGYNIKNGTFNNKISLDPWYESVRLEIEEKEKLLSKKRGLNTTEESKEEVKPQAKEDPEDDQYYGEENLFFSLEEALTSEEKREKEVQVFNNRKAISDRLKQNNQESLAKYLSTIEKAKQNSTKNVTVILSNGKKVRKSNNQANKRNLVGDNKESNKQAEVDRELLDIISELTNLGDHDIMAMTVSEIDSWMEKQMHQTCSYRIIPKDENEQIKEYKDLDINKVKAWITNKILCADEDYDLEFSIDNITWFKNHTLLI